AAKTSPKPSQTFSRQTASAALPEHSKWPLCCQNGANGPFSLVKRPIKHNGRYAHCKASEKANFTASSVLTLSQ
ncbi:hypothetical protein, partial [Aeromonas sp. QDB66]|uniref:hypothetical protein n=1 Tax=Aeromonas sp. QDB66 TaxID=2989824 RepID=UPI0022E10D14